MKSKSVLVVVGTRPEGIKMAPIVHALRAHPRLEVDLCVTGQHREMLQQVLAFFDLRPDKDFDLMCPNQDLTSLAGRAIERLGAYFARSKPDLLLVQGDTTTALCGALAAFYKGIPVGHVEAGLRTWDPQSPFPEEVNRQVITRLGALHFAPTAIAKENLLREGVSPSQVVLTGNTVVDALLLALARLKGRTVEIEGAPDFLRLGDSSARDPRVVLVTGHRRENLDGGIRRICTAIAELSRVFPEVHFVYPVHMNPNVRSAVLAVLTEGRAKEPGGDNVHLLPPLAYPEFIALMSRAHLIITDSGGIQEEAPTLGKPVLVTRDTTERQEAVDCGAAMLVGSSTKAIVSAATGLLNCDKRYSSMADAKNPFGDGRASERIVAQCFKYLCGE